MTGGPTGYLPGDEVLSIVSEEAPGPEEGQVLIRAKILLDPHPWRIRPHTGLSVIEILAERVELG